MSLTLMYITNNIELACIAQKAGVDRIWIDMEYIGKEERQNGMDTVKLHHTVADIKALRPYVTTSELMVRINPVHDACDDYGSTEQEIEEVIESGADVIMLPMFKTAHEVKRFVNCVSGRAKTMLLFETAESVENVDEILSIDGINEVHIGLNDLHLAYGKQFMFELLCDGTVEKLCAKFRQKNIKYGFGGIARVGQGMLPAESIITHHYYLHSTAAILSRGFCDASKVSDVNAIENDFVQGVADIRQKEKEIENLSESEYIDNFEKIKQKVSEIVLNKQKTNFPVKKICMITTVSLTMKSFVVETAKYLHEKGGYDVTLICNNDDEFAKSLPDYLHFLPVKMNRGVDFSAIKSIVAFYKIFKREKFDLVQYSTPNASLYASIASRLAKVPVRLYCQWGIRYVGMSGMSRKIFRFIEHFVCRISTHIRSVSPLNMKFGIDEKLYKENKVKVVGNGGTIGVDLQHYDISKKSTWKSEIRQKYDIKEDDFVFGFAGRVSAGKGCTELFKAFQKLCENNEKVKLLIVGPIEENCGINSQLLQWAQNSEQVISTGLIENSNMCKYYSAMDVLVHPTYREGFGMVIQEAGAMAVPVITTKIIGASEVMIDGESCILVERKDCGELYDAMFRVSSDAESVKRIGCNAYNRTKELYERNVMLKFQKEAYESILRR